MSKMKISFSFLLTLMLVAMFSIVASAAGATPGTAPGDHGGVYNGQVADDKGADNSYNTIDKSNVNQTGSGVGGQTANFNQVIKSDDMVSANGSHGTQRTHGSYMNNTNSCASCHQTHTGASEGLLFKNGEYATCTACHDGTLGFYNVMEKGSDSAGTFGGTHDGNMSAHLANGSVKISAAPGGNNSGTTGRGGEWTEEFTCANCHAPHGSYSDRLLHEDPNGMGNTLLKDGGKKLENVPVVDANTVVDAVNGTKFTTSTKVPTANVTFTDAAGKDQTANYVVYRFKIGDTGAPTNPEYAAKKLVANDVVLQLMKWVPTLDHDGVETGGTYVIDTDPWLHEYDFDDAHTKHYWTAFYDGSVYQNTDSTIKATYTTDANFVGKPIDKVHTDYLKSGEILGGGFAAVHIDATIPTYSKMTNTGLVTLFNSVKTGNIARGYVVKLDVSPLDSNNVATTTITSLWAKNKADGTANPGYVANRGVAMSQFCSACHTDYLASSGKETGTFDHAYRHTTNSDTYTCVRCHYAHGTDVTIMRDARGKKVADIVADPNYFSTVTDPTAREALAKDYMTDKNPSSALKRYTNMAVCWGCHTSSHSGGTRNTDSYQYNSTANETNDRNGIEFDY